MWKMPKRYRDVLALVKALARDTRVPDAALRAMLAGADGASYGAADMAVIAALHGWELALVPTKEGEEPEAPLFATTEQYQAEVRRLHADLRRAKEVIADYERRQQIADRKMRERSAQRTAQLAAAGVGSIDDAFTLLLVYRAALEAIVAEGYVTVKGSRYATVAAEALASVTVLGPGKAPEVVPAPEVSDGPF